MAEGEASGPVEPPPSAARVALRRRLPVGLAVVAAVVVVTVAVVARGRAPKSGATTVSADTAHGALPPVASADSARVAVGGSLPKGTTISVDGVDIVGMRVTVAPGQHAFRATAPGYLTAAQSIALTAGQQMTWTPIVIPEPPGGSHSARATPTVTADSHATVSHATPRPSPTMSTPATAVPARAAARVNRSATGGNRGCAALFSAQQWGRALPSCQHEAADGSIASERTLGALYERGLGTGVDFKQAAVWYQRAADGGDRVAQYRLGTLERDGNGVRHDDKKAVALFRQSAEQGDADAQSAMGTAYERGDGVKRDYTQAVDWYRKAADQGHPGAAYRLGALYDAGKGVTKSEVDAIMWWKKAAAEGEASAPATLARHHAAP